MKRLGLDLGSSSAGWALREDEKIIANGVVTFHSGMIKGQTGGYTSPTRDRRTARSKRKLIQARKYRKWELLETLLNEFVPLDKTELENWSKYKKGQAQKFPENPRFLKWLACDFVYEGGIKYLNPYELRIKALDNKLSKHEFGRALYHLIQRRGYKNIGEVDEETKKQIERRGESGFEEALNNNRTIAEALAKEFLENGERARNQYPYRAEYQNELEQICKGQEYDITKNEKGEYNNEFLQKLFKAIIWQRPLRSQKGNIGKCTLEPTKPRCPVSHPVFEIFRALSFINTIKCSDNYDEEKEVLPQSIREILLTNFFLKKDANFKFEEIRKFIDKEYKSNKIYNYPYDLKKEIYDSSVSGMPVCKGLVDVFGEQIKEAIARIHNYNIGNATKIIGEYSIYDLWHILFEFDEKHLVDFAINKLKIQNKKNKKGNEYNPFTKLKSSITQGYSDLSLKAMCKIIPFLKEGFLYNEAVVLAKMPELLGESWEQKKKQIKDCIKNANDIYNQNKKITGITNNLIDQYKGLEYPEIYAFRDYTYKIKDNHDDEILKSCTNYYGEKSWVNRTDKNEIFEEVKMYYQLFFYDPKRAYAELPLLTEILAELLKNENIEIKGKLYHHSNRENLYLKKIKNSTTGKIKLPVDKKTGLEILPNPIIDSIKNPMFNKSMNILKKLINEMIVNTEFNVDSDTEVVIEVASELNDNNMRAAIERYQNYRRNNRERYRQFLNEFKEKENKSINVDESIATFELWTEQTFEEIENENRESVKNKNNGEIHKEKNALIRYELWMEQKGQCMYTGKMISISQLFSNEIDIEHTIPRWILPDNTMANKTVCYKWYNTNKKKKLLPTHCDNYSKDADRWGTRIEPRLDNWINIRDGFKKQYEDRIKPRGSEDEKQKNTRIQEKHYFKLHFAYWQDKISRFTADEVKDSWARRQLVDTQMVSKYAREFLKTYFKKVAVQKGIITAEFRKIYSFQEQDEIKSRNRHTHHTIDAAVLTLIPTNSSHRDKILKKAYEIEENEKRQFTTVPYAGFNSQKLINDIENKTLIVNYENDTILKHTSKIVRKRGRIQFVKNKEGKFILDENKEKIIKIAQGDTVRSTLYKDTFVAKIRDVERCDDGHPKRENGDWKYKKGKDEFTFAVRKPIKDVLANIDDIIDPIIREIVRVQKENSIDPQGKKIRHVRIKTKTGQVVKDRVNYKSQHDYKNKYYAAAGSLPYAILLQKTKEGKVERAMTPVASFEISKTHKETGSFNIHDFILKHHPEYKNYTDKRLLKVGQKVIVLKNDKEYEKRDDKDFQTNRLYVITQFSESIWLKYHIEAQSDGDIDNSIKEEKNLILRRNEKEFDIPEVIEDVTIENKLQRKEDYIKRKYSFASLDTFRFKRLVDKTGKEKTKEIKKELDKLKKQSAKIEIEGKTPLLKMSSENWNFLYEGNDFEITMLGELKWKSND